MVKKHKADNVNWENVLNTKNLLQIFIGSAMAVFAMKGFMIPNQFMDGGVTGISILLHEISHIPVRNPIFSSGPGFENDLDLPSYFTYSYSEI